MMRQLCAVQRQWQPCPGAAAAIPDGRECGHAIYATKRDRKVAWTFRKGREAVLPEPPPEAWATDATFRDSETLQDEVFAIVEWKEKEKIVVGHRSGLLYECPSNGQDLEEPELVGQVPGLCGLATSPDGEHMVVATGQGRLLQLNSEYEVLAEVELGEGFETTTVTITWRGDGKFLATNSSHGGSRAVRVWERDGLIHHSDAELDGSTEAALSWEPRGGLLAVAMEEGGAVQMLERNGLKRGELVLQQSQYTIRQLCWSPDSEILGALVEQNNTVGVETVPHETQAGLPAQQKFAVQLWHRCNHHWYLKWQESIHGTAQLLWDDVDSKTLHVFNRLEEGWTSTRFMWDDATVSNMGTTVTSDGSSILLNTFRKTVVPPPMCNMAIMCSAPTTAVCASSFADQEYVAAVLSSRVLAIATSQACGDWSAPLADISNECQAGAMDGVIRAKEVALDLPQRSFVRQLVWQAPWQVLLLVDDFTTGTLCERFVSVEISWDEGEKIKAQVARNICLDEIFEFCGRAIARIASVVKGNSRVVLVSLVGKNSDAFASDCTSSVACFDGSHMQELSICRGRCYWLLPWMMDHDSSISFAARSVERELFLEGALIASNVRSFSCHFAGTKPTMLYVTDDNVLHSLRLVGSSGQGNATYEPMGQSSAETTNNTPVLGRNWQRRAVESGARLVAVPSSSPMVVLQMPRGNLEGIYPRSLVLAMVLSMLEEDRYSDAFTVVCRHRIDLNILVDYKWPFAQTKAGARTLVVSLADPQRLIELVHALKPGNVLQKDGVYAGTVEYESHAGPTDFGNEVSDEKINKVCVALRSVMVELDAPYYGLPILSTYFRSQPPLLGDALLHATSFNLLSSGSKEGHTTAPEADGLSSSESSTSTFTMMKHSLVYCEEESLYRAALALYNLELAAVVVSYAQAMDPGEKLPELQAFDDISPIEKQHAHVDLYLGRLSLAAKNFALAGDRPSFEKSLEIARQAPEEVFPVLLQQFPSNCVERSAEAGMLRIALGESLLGRGRAEEAAVAYISGGEVEQALHAYRTAGAWRMVLSLAGRLGWNTADVKSLALELAEELLIEAPKDAATILLEYVNDAQRGVEILASTGAWRDAIRAAYRYSRPDLVDTLLAPAAAASLVRALEEFREDRSRLEKYIARLRTLRQRRAAMAAALGTPGQDPVAEDENTEVISEVGTSIMSDYSAYTHRTAVSGATNGTTPLTSASAASCVGRRNRRNGKREKKKGRIRAGAPNEEFALLQHLKQCPMAPHMRESHGELAELLVLLGHEQDAKLLQTVLSNLVAFQDKLAENSILAMQEMEGSGVERTTEHPRAGKAKWKWALLRGDEESSDSVLLESSLKL